MDFQCRHCGEPQKSSYYIPEVASILARARLCAKCHYWTQILARKDDPRSVRVAGVQYWIIEGRRPPPFNGFDGTKCEFSSKDIFDWNGLRGQPLRIYLGMGSYARVLWRLGVIPPNLRAQLPDNHRPEEGPALLPELSEAEIRASTGAWLTEVSCTKDGRLALCGTLRCDVLLFPLPGDGPDFLGIEHRGAIARISPDGRTIASAVDEDLMISDAGDGRFQFRLEGHENAVLSIAFSPDGTRLATCGKRELMVSDLVQRESVLRQVDDDLFAVAFLGTDQLVTCGRRGRLARLDLRTGEEVFSAESHLGRAGCVAISPDGTRALTGGRDQTIRLWETSTLCQLAAFSAAGPVHSVCFSTTGALAFYGTDTAVGAIELETGAACLRQVNTINPFALLNSGVLVAAHPEGGRLITASQDGLVRLWPVPCHDEKESYPFLIMSPGAIQEFWLFLHCGVADRKAAIAARSGELDESTRRRLPWEIDALERLLVAFRDVTRTSWGRPHIDEDTWFYTVVRGSPLDEVGVALMSECLDRQKQFWAGKAEAGGDSADEAAARLGVLEEAHGLFHERLGLSRQQVERRCQDLWVTGDLWDGGRSRYQDVTAFGQVVVPGDEAPVTPEELKRRMAAARRQSEAARAEGSHDQ